MNPTKPDRAAFKTETDADWDIVTEGIATRFKSPADCLASKKISEIRFGKHEVEESARLLVRFFADRGGWGIFSLGELEKFCIRNGYPDAGAALFGLWGVWVDNTMTGIIRSADYPPYIVQFSTHEFGVTSVFIDKLNV